MNSTKGRPPGSPSRTNSQRQRILKRLREAGARGVLAAEFYDDPLCRYGRSPRNRVSELRRRRTSTGASERLATAGPRRRLRGLALCSTAKGAASK